ncbi:MAG: FAD-binding and (Fe-S)-binding domain-containing protein, partial [Proteobacteria bacterium]|nr:FAD-binding and (Fe-S)-binding domain-containing protein [Pseudomonadota bacterium]
MSNYNKSRIMVVKSFINALQTSFDGDIEFSLAQNFVQASDNSIYQLIPDAVIYPKNSADIVSIIKLSLKDEFKEIKFTARGGATGTNGQSLNHGIIIDCVRYFNKIIQLSLAEGWVDVEAGLVLKDLNDFLKPHGYHFAPHISPDDRATIGGMIATDACGKGSFIFGKTSDNLISADCVLANAQNYTFQNIDLSKADAKASQIIDLLKGKEELISQKFPNITRFVSGYNLGKLISQDNILRMPYLLAGSEGTLGIVTKARLKITKINPYKALIVVGYDSLANSLKDALNLLNFQPLAIESMDDKILDLARKQPLSPFIQDLIKDVQNINIVEFQAATKQLLDQQVKAFMDDYSQKTLAKNAAVFYESKQIEQIWDLRKTAVGIAGNLKGDKKPTPFIEDVCVAIENIANYNQELSQLLDKYGLYYVIYGHLDVGCLHVRPALDLTTDQDKKLIRELTPQVIKLVKKYNGVVWGEHSAGCRVEYSPEIFGAEIFNIFCQIKAIFDPLNRFNPKKIAGKELVKIDQNLQADFNRAINADLRKQFANAIFCNGNAKCLSVKLNQAMCPSYKATKEKIHSPKGRANLIRHWLNFRSQNPLPKSFIKKLIYKYRYQEYLAQIHHSLKGCLSCKSCSNSCPVSVDIPTYKSLFLNWYHQLYRRNLRDFVFCKSEELLKLMAQFLLISKLSKPFAKLLGITDSPPAYSNNDQQNIVTKAGALHDLPQNTIFIISDSFSSFAEKDLLHNSVSLLHKMGFNVRLIPHFVSGKAYLNAGKIAKFQQLAKRNITLLE